MAERSYKDKRKLQSWVIILAAMVAVAAPCIDFLAFDRKLLGWALSSTAFLVFFVVGFVFYVLAQLVVRNLRLEFALLICSFVLIPIVIVIYAYQYSVGHVCASGQPTASVKGEPTLAACRLSDNEESLYYSTVTFTTLGYGEYTPRGSTRFTAASQALIGFVFMPLLLGQIIGLMRDWASTRDREAAEIEKRRSRIQKRQ